MTLREAISVELEKDGKTQSYIKQITNSKTLVLAETILAKNEGMVSETAVERAKQIEAEIEKNRITLLNLLQQIRQMQNTIGEMKIAVNEVNGSVKDYVSEKSQYMIEDDKIKDALVMYCQMLRATQEIFGAEKMTEEVMMKAIEAGSYGVWRGIMGGKDNANMSLGRR